MTRPMEAAGRAPSLPTMAASMYSIITEDTWASMAGMLRSRVSL